MATRNDSGIPGEGIPGEGIPGEGTPGEGPGFAATVRALPDPRSVRALLGTDEPAACQVIAPPAGAVAGVGCGPDVAFPVLGPVAPLVVCDHASARIPRILDFLGLPAPALAGHVAWDIGAADLGRRLAARLGGTLVLSGYSRLVIDVNRPLDDPSSIPAVSDAVSIPGNRELTAQARRERTLALFVPYHDAIAGEIDRLVAAGRTPAVISLHSFTPSLGGARRPWHCGVLWNRDDRLAAPLIKWLEREPDLVVGDNEPYSGRSPNGYTMPFHADGRGLPNVLLEIRQDLLSTPEGLEQWSARLERLLRRALERISRPGAGTSP